MVDGIAVERILHGENYASGSAAAGDFFDGDGVGGMYRSKPAPHFGFGDGDAGEAEFGGFLETFTREVAGFVEFFGERTDVGCGELADGFFQ